MKGGGGQGTAFVYRIFVYKVGAIVRCKGNLRGGGVDQGPAWVCVGELRA